MGKLFLFINLLRKGESLTDPKVLNDRTAFTMALTGVLWTANTIAKAFGFNSGLSEMDAAQLAGSIVIAVGLFRYTATSPEVGILPARKEGTAGTEQPAVDNVRSELGDYHATQDELRNRL